MSNISKSREYEAFRSSVPKQSIITGRDSVPWHYFDVNLANSPEAPTIVMIPGTSGTCEVFFQQCLTLGSSGYRVVSVTVPPYWDLPSFCVGLDEFANHLGLKTFHIFGASLGGYMALHYINRYPERVTSVILCNAFVDTLPFRQTPFYVSSFKWLPGFYLQKYVLDSFPQATDVPDVIDFCVECFETLTKAHVGSRLTLNCMESSLDPVQMDPSLITILETNDDVVLPGSMRARLHEKFSKSTQALIKEGGDFPYLSAAEDVNLFIRVHLQRQGLTPQNSLPEGKESQKLEEGDVKSDSKHEHKLLDISKPVDTSSIHSKYDTSRRVPRKQRSAEGSTDKANSEEERANLERVRRVHEEESRRAAAAVLKEEERVREEELRNAKRVELLDKLTTETGQDKQALFM